MDSIIGVKDITHRYGETQALAGVSLEIPPGFFALLGPNGAGKSTLVSLLSTLSRIQQGEAWVAGHSVRAEPSAVRQQLGLVFQEPSLDDRLSLLENLQFHALIYRVPSRERGKRIGEVLELVELGEWANAPVRALSRGMKRRLEIGRAILHQPQLLILDEPTTGLDVQSRRRIWEYLNRLRGQGVSLLLTTHQLEEAEQADQIAILDQGKVLTEGSPAQLRQQHGQPTVVLQVDEPELIQQLLSQYRAKRSGQTLHITLADPNPFLAEFMPRHGAKVKGLQVMYPSLEDVFVLLTGRALREDPAAGREAMLSFAKSGGEHTR